MKALPDWVCTGYPRLVRLNPNIPWKTRGNGAVALRLQPRRLINVKSVYEELTEKKIGSADKTVFYGYETNNTDYVEPMEDFTNAAEELLDKISGVVDEFAMHDDENTNPGIVIARRPFDHDLYRRAVTDVVKLSEVEAVLDAEGSVFKGYNNRRGLIGASSALAWEPSYSSRRRTPAATFELIAYRERDRWGTERRWDESSAAELDREIPSSFDNYDDVNSIPRIVPHTPCPVLYGVRGTDGQELRKALTTVRTDEVVDRWLIFETNHATDDHIVPSSVSEFSRYRTVRTEGKITGSPAVVKGGHTFIELVDKNGKSFISAAYEPTKQFRDVIRKLLTGDEVTASGALRCDNDDGSVKTQDPENFVEFETFSEEPTVNLEKLEVRYLVDVNQKTGNPICSSCGKSMKSIGKGQGYRCRNCGTHAGENDAIKENVQREIRIGFYEAAVCARRHLTCPLKLYKH